METPDAIDPYAPPAADTGTGPIDQPHALRDLVLSWEKRRLSYNLAMLPPGLLILVLFVVRNNMPIPGAIMLGLMSGIGANAAFLLGPLTELYARGLFMHGRSAPFLRNLLFYLGLGLSLLITLVFLGIAAFA
jgi:hypothetical protein